MNDIKKRDESGFQSRLSVETRETIAQFVSFIVIAAGFAVGAFIFTGSLWPYKRMQDNNYLVMLEKTKENLTRLTAYVENQSDLVRSTNKLLTELQQRRDQLKPILDTDIKAVDAVFRAHEDRQRAQRIWDIVIAFVLGVLSSIVTNLMWPTLRRWLRIRETSPEGM
jgi:hypothetical protein